jgi:hypothetical protein
VTGKLPEGHHTEVKTRWWKTFDRAASSAEAAVGCRTSSPTTRNPYLSAMAVIERASMR